MSQTPFKTRLGRAGLDALMRDPRYWDDRHPLHSQVVDAVQRGFQLVFDDDGDTPAGLAAGPRPPGAFARIFAARPVAEAEFDASPPKLREDMGRKLVLAALESDGRPFPGSHDDLAQVTMAANDNGEEKQGDGPRKAWQPPRPLDEDGKEIAPDPRDPRFDPDGTLKEEWAKNPTLRWGAMNLHFDPETGEFIHYRDMPEFTSEGGRWRMRERDPVDPIQAAPDKSEKLGKIVLPPKPSPCRKPRDRARFGRGIAGWILRNFGDEIREFMRGEDSQKDNR